MSNNNRVKIDTRTICRTDEKELELGSMGNCYHIGQYRWIKAESLVNMKAVCFYSRVCLFMEPLNKLNITLAKSLIKTKIAGQNEINTYKQNS